MGACLGRLGHVPADWKASEQLVLQGLSLGNSAETSGGDLLGVELERKETEKLVTGSSEDDWFRV